MEVQFDQGTFFPSFVVVNNKPQFSFVEYFNLVEILKREGNFQTLPKKKKILTNILLSCCGWGHAKLCIYNIWRANKRGGMFVMHPF